MIDKHILIVDDNKANLAVAKDALSEYYHINLVISGEQALSFLEKKKTDLILLDISMPGMDGIETFKHIKKNPEWSKIPVIFLTADNAVETEVECLELGAMDFIQKPFIAPLMRSRIAKTLELSELRHNLEISVKIKANQITSIQQKVIMSFADLIESRDDFTGRHVKRTSAYVRAIVEELKKRGMYSDILTNSYIDDLCKAAPMHDIGKIRISDIILCKPGKLTDEEFEIMKTHTTEGDKILESTLKDIESDEYIKMAREVSLYHHEKWNGTGYPTGIKGEEIPLGARIMALADVFDALISKRVYKDPMPMDKAFGIIEESLGSHFDPELGKVFLEMRSEIERISKLDVTDL